MYKDIREEYNRAGHVEKKRNEMHKDIQVSSLEKKLENEITKTRSSVQCNDFSHL